MTVVVSIVSSPAVVVVIVSSPPLWCGCGGGNGLIHPLYCGPSLIVVSSTPCGVALVLVMVVVMVTRLHCHVEVLGARLTST